MAQVSYALREDPNSIFLLQDAGRCYDKYCQITSFGRNIVRPEFLGQYMYFAPYSSGKYHGSVTDLQMSIEDNGYIPMNNYVAVIDSEVEFRITPTVIRNLSRDHMPAWGVKSYLDYFSDRKSGVLLFLRVYKVAQSLAASFLEKGVRGSSQVIKLYDKYGEDVTLSVNVIEPVISDNKFSYLKDEIIHLLKVENALIAQYNNTESGIHDLQQRIIADRQLQGTKERWKDQHLQWLDDDSDDIEDFDMAQLDYESIYQEVLEIAPSMKSLIDYVRNIQAARLGEYDYYLQDVHMHTASESASINRLFDMSLRAAVKAALYYYKRNNMDLEDAFQEACIGIIMAIRKHNDNVSALFPSYASLWMRQIMSRYLSPYDYNVRLPVHYTEHVIQAIQQLPGYIQVKDIKELDYRELYFLLINNTGCDEQEAFRMAYILCPAESIERIIDDDMQEEYITDERNLYEDLADNISREAVRDAMNTLKERERDVLIYRFGFNGHPETSLEGVGDMYGITRERVRQIEAKAKQKVLAYFYRNHYITQETYDSVLNVDENGKAKIKGKKQHVVTKKLNIEHEIPCEPPPISEICD